MNLAIYFRQIYKILKIVSLDKHIEGAHMTLFPFPYIPIQQI